MELSEKEKDLLITCARDSIKSLLNDKIPQHINYSDFPSLKIFSGAFVTLRINSGLRGCIGYILSKMPLYETISEAARQAAFNDPRFPPLTPGELDMINIEISVLTQPEPVECYEQIKIGTHGLLLEEEFNKSVLLPQVATENNFDLEEFLSVLCEKAGLNKDYWRSKKINLKKFEAVIFSEKSMREI